MVNKQTISLGFGKSVYKVLPSIAIAGFGRTNKAGGTKSASLLAPSEKPISTNLVLS